MQRVEPVRRPHHSRFAAAPMLVTNPSVVWSANRCIARKRHSSTGGPNFVALGLAEWRDHTAIRPILPSNRRRFRADAADKRAIG